MQQLDLNLLRLLHLILIERSVTRAAERLGLSQPAASNGLNRLRKSLDDPLIVSTPRGMVPTSRGAALEAPLRRMFEDLEAALTRGAAFDPASAARRFALAASDYGLAVLLGPLVRLLASSAPAVDLDVRPLREPAPFASLEEGDLDVAVGFFPRVPPSFYTKVLFRDEFVGVLRRGHPVVERGLSLDAFLSLPHVLISPDGRQRGLVDEALAERGLSRRIALRVPHFLSALLIVADSDYFVTMPARIARRMAPALGVEAHALPVALGDVVVSAIWHERRHHNPAHAWLRTSLAGLVPMASEAPRDDARRAPRRTPPKRPVRVRT